MEAHEYITIKAPTEAKLVERKSTFLAFAHPVHSVEEAETLFQQYRKQYYDARHVCFAYVIGADGQHQRAYDNGEPSGTAGRPIQGVLLSRGLKNVVVFVVRYFGGIKLGTPGLIAAYRTATELALDAAECMTRIVEEHIDFTFDYLSMNAVMQLVKRFPVTIVTQEMDNACHYCLTVPKAHYETFLAALAAIDTVRIKD